MSFTIPDPFAPMAVRISEISVAATNITERRAAVTPNARQRQRTFPDLSPEVPGDPVFPDQEDQPL